MKNNFFIFRSFRARITFFLILAMILAGATSNFLVYRYALHFQFEQLREKLMTIAQTAALTVDADELQAIPLEKGGVDSLQFKTVSGKLARIRKAIPAIRHIYILTRTEKPEVFKFMADADAGKSNEGPVTFPGDEYDASKFPEMINAFNGPSADRKLDEDDWGVFLSGYSPLYDRDGAVIAVLGVDMKAQDVYDMQKDVHNRALAVLILGIIFSVFLGVLISGGAAGQIKELMKGAERIAKGDLEHRVKIKGGDELSRLGNLFNRMSVSLKHHMKELERTTAEKERLVKEIEIASGIQRSFLPDFAPKIPGLEIAALSLPARVVGGDFYDFIPLASGRWGFVVADVSGKGVPAALFMALSRTLMRSTAAGALTPSDAINHANKLILQDSKASMFVTLFYAIVNAGTMVFQYANAGHNPPLYVTDGKDNIVFLKAQGVPLGISSDIESATNDITLKKGDMVLIYTDGVTEAVNSRGEQFEMERLEKIAKGARHLPAQGIMDRVMEGLKSFVGTEQQYDDITIMVLKVM
ncbi:MAG: SpoIIE family protein phosphatase [Candidatus Omnitrophica bacterium]|nr:SpoIIE family protein phosphatase [Candidatus Omnitrophota bacterium]